MRKIRVFFTKLGRAKYISHLDSNRCWQRSIKRSGLPVWYTEGFNPHMYLTFPLPLSLGYESRYECVDLRLLEELSDEEVVERLNEALPTDIHVFACAEPQMDQKEIAWADYDIFLSSQQGAELVEKLQSYFTQKQILVQKKTKKGFKEVDLKPLFSVLKLEAVAEDSANDREAGAALTLRCTTGIEVNINPSLLLENFPESHLIEGTATCRTMVYNEKLEQFR